MLKRNSLQWLGVILVSLIFFNACVPIQRVPAGDAAAEAATETTVVAEAGGDEEPPERGAVAEAGCSTLTQDKIDSFIAEHNRVRAEAVNEDGKQRGNLSWSPEVACQAQEWAQAIVDGTWKQNSHYNANVEPHSQPSTFNILWFAENIAFAETPQASVKSWESEKQYYNLQTTECQPGQECGHYVSAINPNYTMVGCGMAEVASAQPGAYNGFTRATVCQYINTVISVGGSSGEIFNEKHTSAKATEIRSVIIKGQAGITYDIELVNHNDVAPVRLEIKAPNGTQIYGRAAWPVETQLHSFKADQSGDYIFELWAFDANVEYTLKVTAK